jgi:hypothetical protein
LRPRRGALLLAVGCGLTFAAVGPRTGPLAPAAAHAQPVVGAMAPELAGGTGCINASKPFRLLDLRGKIVVLDFWTLC